MPINPQDLNFESRKGENMKGLVITDMHGYPLTKKFQWSAHKMNEAPPFVHANDTVKSLVNIGAFVHWKTTPFYIRRAFYIENTVIIDKNDPLVKLNASNIEHLFYNGELEDLYDKDN